jgi:polysaccharide export outer membrane protein
MWMTTKPNTIKINEATMSNITHNQMSNEPKRGWVIQVMKPAGAVLLSLLVSIAVTGCQTQKPSPLPSASEPAVSDVIVLNEGDAVRVTFPGAPNLDTTQRIRRDGRVTLPLIGEFKAVGLTPKEMEAQLLELYGPQLQTKEVIVAVESSAFVVYVTGAVLRPGKILSDRPITALEAVMEAGGFNYTKANTKQVRIIRNEDGRSVHYTVNLKQVLAGQSDRTFSLKPSDIIYVPERFSWF